MKKVVIVTGASSGIGLAIATYLAKNDYIVYGGSRSATPNDDFHVVKLDVTDSNSILSVVTDILQKEGRIDVLVNNAGIGSAGAVEKTPIEDIRKSFDVNFFGVIQMILTPWPSCASTYAKATIWKDSQYEYAWIYDRPSISRVLQLEQGSNGSNDRNAEVGN